MAKNKILIMLAAIFLCMSASYAYPGYVHGPMTKTNDISSNHQISSATLEHHYKIQYPVQVSQMLQQVHPQYMWSDLVELTVNYPNRSSLSSNGEKAAVWLKAYIEKIVKESGRQDIEIYTVNTGKVLGWNDKLVESKQPSIILKIGRSSEPGIVISAHFDSVEPIPYELCMQDELCRQCIEDAVADRPGADDDGSGTVTVLEVARTLLNSHMHFKKPIYLIWYAAEEDGLVGSKQVVKDFQKRNIQIEAVLQLDMTGYAYQNDFTMWLVDNNVDLNLTHYLSTLIKTYVKRPVNLTTSSGIASDHTTWHEQGIPVAFPFEGEMTFGHYNYNLHSKTDTVDKLSLTHMTSYEKLAIAFAVELAEPRP